MNSIQNFGKHLKFSESKSSSTSSEKKVFINTLGLMKTCIARSWVMHDEFSIDLSEYESPLFVIMENLIYLKYGPEVLELIIYWLYNDNDEPIQILGADEEIIDEVIIKTPANLWSFIKTNFKDKQQSNKTEK